MALLDIRVAVQQLRADANSISNFVGNMRVLAILEMVVDALEEIERAAK